jgi:ABC-2 type transport system permease protein
MRLLTVFRTTVREQLRSPWDLLLTLALTPFFVWMYWSFVGGGSTYFDVLVINHDRGACPLPGGGSCAEQVIARLGQLSYENGNPMLKVTVIEERAVAEVRLRDRSVEVLIIFSDGFTTAIAAGKPLENARVTFVGDLGYPYYATAAVFANSVLESYLREAAGQPSPIQVTEEALGGSARRSEFEIYVPGLLIAAGTMMLFSVAIALTRQIEAGTLRRLQLTRMTAFDLLGGIGLVYVILSLLSVLIAFGTALWLGFHSLGPLWVAMLVCALSAIAVIGMGLITACFSGTVGRAAVIVNFPLFFLLFFSGAIFPIANPRLFSLAGHPIGVFDFLPQTHATIAINKVMTLGSGFGDVTFELGALALLSLLYFVLGVILFRRMHLKAG